MVTLAEQSYLLGPGTCWVRRQMSSSFVLDIAFSGEIRHVLSPQQEAAVDWTEVGVAAALAPPVSLSLADFLGPPPPPFCGYLSWARGFLLQVLMWKSQGGEGRRDGSRCTGTG